MKELDTFTINGDGNGHGPRVGGLKAAFARWERMIDTGIDYYVKALDVVLRHRLMAAAIGFGLLAVTVVVLWPILRKEFFPEVDAGAFEMYVRAPSGTADREDRAADRRRRGVRPQDDRRGGPPADPLGDRRDPRLVGRLHAQRRPDGRGGARSSSRPSGRSRPRSTSHELRDEFADEPDLRRPGVRLRRRRHGPLGDERGQVHADQHPGHRQGPEDGPPDRHRDPRRGRRRSTAWSTRGSSSGSTIPSTSSRWTGPSRPSWG